MILYYQPKKNKAKIHKKYVMIKTLPIRPASKFVQPVLLNKMAASVAKAKIRIL